MKSTILVVILVVAVAAGSAHAQFRPSRKKNEDKYADVNIEEVCEDRCEEFVMPMYARKFKGYVA